MAGSPWDEYENDAHFRRLMDVSLQQRGVSDRDYFRVIDHAHGYVLLLVPAGDPRVRSLARTNYWVAVMRGDSGPVNFVLGDITEGAATYKFDHYNPPFGLLPQMFVAHEDEQQWAPETRIRAMQFSSRFTRRPGDFEIVAFEHPNDPRFWRTVCDVMAPPRAVYAAEAA